MKNIFTLGIDSGSNVGQSNHSMLFNDGANINSSSGGTTDNAVVAFGNVSINKTQNKTQNISINISLADVSEKSDCISGVYNAACNGDLKNVESLLANQLKVSPTKQAGMCGL